MSKTNSKAYIIHYTPLELRRKSILLQCSRENLIPEFISEFDREKLSPDVTKKFSVSDARISACLKHIEAWRRIYNSTEENYGLILEDDAFVCQNFLNRLNECLIELEKIPFDVLMINEGCGFHIPQIFQRPDRKVYHRGILETYWGGNGGTRCADGYIISKKCAKNFISYYENCELGSINLPIDHWMNHMMRQFKSLVFWSEPSLVKQGSETGDFPKSYSY
jgi:hypothetical protein